MKFHKDGSKPAENQIFVFGSNLSGIHGKGAAKTALIFYGAKWGVAEGPTGMSYALPTVKKNISGPRELVEIQRSVDIFLLFAKHTPNTEFFVTRVGCGLAGYSDAQIAPMFKNAPDNCSFAEEWSEFLL